MRPSVTSWCNARRAISRRTGSNADNTIASGVSSVNDFHAGGSLSSASYSYALSRPMMRPLISSDSIWNTVTGIFDSRFCCYALNVDCITMRLAFCLRSLWHRPWCRWCRIAPVSGFFLQGLYHNVFGFFGGKAGNNFQFRFPGAACVPVPLLLVDDNQLGFQILFHRFGFHFLRWISSWRWFSTSSRCFNLFFCLLYLLITQWYLFLNPLFLVQELFPLLPVTSFFLITSASVSASLRILSYLTPTHGLKNMYEENADNETGNGYYYCNYCFWHFINLF